MASKLHTCRQDAPTPYAHMFKQTHATPPFVFSVTESVARSGRAAPDRARAEDIKLLYQLASDFDSISPKLAAQLRGIAERH